jgi:hypothetical protein
VMLDGGGHGGGVEGGLVSRKGVGLST